MGPHYVLEAFSLVLGSRLDKPRPSCKVTIMSACFPSIVTYSHLPRRATMCKHMSWPSSSSDIPHAQARWDSSAERRPIPFLIVRLKSISVILFRQYRTPILNVQSSRIVVEKGHINTTAAGRPVAKEAGRTEFSHALPREWM